METEQQVAAILEGWRVTTCAHNGAFWTIAAYDPSGQQHAGSRADPLDLARDLARLYQPAPEPADVQPTPQVEVSAPPDSAPMESGGDAHVEELAEPQREPASQVEEPPEPQHVAPAYAGTMLQEDRENYLRGIITVRVTQIEQNRLAGRFDANARERQRVGFIEFHNASDLGLPITDEVRAAYEEFLAADQWVRATKDHADALRNAAITVGLPLLEAMQTSIEEGWP